MIPRITASPAAEELIDRLRAKHGELIFHQSGGCCDGSAPMCFEKGDLRIGSRDLLLGEVHGCPFYMAADQFEHFRQSVLLLDVCEGRGSSFSLEIPLGYRFFIRSTVMHGDDVERIAAPVWPDDTL